MNLIVISSAYIMIPFAINASVVSGFYNYHHYDYVIVIIIIYLIEFLDPHSLAFSFHSVEHAILPH